MPVVSPELIYLDKVISFSQTETECRKSQRRLRGNVARTVEPQQAYGRVAQCRHDLWQAFDADLRTAFIKGHIAHPVQLILNPPMPAP